MLLGMLAGDEILKKGLINLEDLNSSPDKFKVKRRRFSAVQKLVCDEFELYKAMVKASNGMSLMMLYFERDGTVKNIIAQENVEHNVYDSRFGIFANLVFPRYRSYDE